MLLSGGVKHSPWHEDGRSIQKSCSNLGCLGERATEPRCCPGIFQKLWTQSLGQKVLPKQHLPYHEWDPSSAPGAIHAVWRARQCVGHFACASDLTQHYKVVILSTWRPHLQLQPWRSSLGLCSLVPPWGAWYMEWAAVCFVTAQSIRKSFCQVTGSLF